MSRLILSKVSHRTWKGSSQERQVWGELYKFKSKSGSKGHIRLHNSLKVHQASSAGG
jgi:hypothetical protein